MFAGPLEDRIAIRELHDQYSDAVCRNNASDWGDVWAEDAVWTLMGTKVEGREAIVGLWTQAMSAFEAVSFLSVPASIEVDGDRATGRTQTHEILKEVDGTRLIGGLYLDEFVKQDGQWLYAARDFSPVVEYQK